MKSQISNLKSQNDNSKVKSLGKIVKLYTRSGDKGESGLSGGERLPKSDMVFEVLGGIDEVDSLIGLAISEVAQASKGEKHNVQEVRKVQKVREELLRIQNMLLVIGAVVSGSEKVKLEEKEISFLEKRIDWYQGQLGEEWYTQFLLPGGSELAARIDVARSVCRRVERVWSKSSNCELRIANCELVGKYLNRLSGYLFALRCYVNYGEKVEEKKFTGSSS